MKLKSLFCFSFLFFSLTSFLSAEPTYPLSIEIEDSFEKSWDLVSERVSEEEVVLDWLPKGEKPTEAKSSFTVQAYQLEDDFEISALLKKFIGTLEEQVEPSDILHHEVLAQDDSSVFFEWWISPPYKDASHEWIKISKNAQHQLAIVRYQSALLVRSDSEKPWIECVKNSEMQETFLQNKNYDLISARLEHTKKADQHLDK